MNFSNPPSFEEVSRVLQYDAETGLFTNLSTRQSRSLKGELAGMDHPAGYFRIGIGGKKYLAHRLAWLLTHGEWPSQIIDHVDGDRKNNRISNLRIATHAQNSQNSKIPSNNTSGVKGVTWNKNRSKWQAQIMTSGKYKYLGVFDNVSDASEAIKNARSDLHEKFTRHS